MMGGKKNAARNVIPDHCCAHDTLDAICTNDEVRPLNRTILQLDLDRAIRRDLMRHADAPVPLDSSMRGATNSSNSFEHGLVHRRVRDHRLRVPILPALADARPAQRHRATRAPRARRTHRAQPVRREPQPPAHVLRRPSAVPRAIRTL
jgi:hypothetical protein